MLWAVADDLVVGRGGTPAPRWRRGLGRQGLGQAGPPRRGCCRRPRGLGLGRSCGVGLSLAQTAGPLHLLLARVDRPCPRQAAPPGAQALRLDKVLVPCGGVLHARRRLRGWRNPRGPSPSGSPAGCRVWLWLGRRRRCRPRWALGEQLGQALWAFLRRFCAGLAGFAAAAASYSLRFGWRGLGRWRGRLWDGGVRRRPSRGRG